MTVVLGQQFIKGIILIADSRASIEKDNKLIPWRDNTQKIFRLSHDIFIGLAGDIEFAGIIIAFLIRQIKERPKLGQLYIFSAKSPKLIKYAYEESVKKLNRRPLVQFIIGGVDYSRPAPVVGTDGRIEGHLPIYDKKLFKLSSPGFESIETSMISSVIAIGSGTPAFESIKSEFEDMKFDKFTFSTPLGFTAVLLGDILSKKIKEMGIDSVGGMIQIVTIEDNHSGFIPYQSRSSTNIDPQAPLDLEIFAKQNGRLYQKNLKTSREVPLLFPPEVVSIQDSSVELFDI